MRKTFQSVVVCLLVLVFLTSCSRDTVICDKMELLKDGASISYKLDPGKYQLEMTASNDGASVEWVGASCPASGQTNNLSTACVLAQTGQVIVRNPSVFGNGKSTTVTIKITKLKE